MWRAIGLFVMAIGLFGAAALVIYTCAHTGIWWSILIGATWFIAFFLPHVCFGYRRERPKEITMTDEDYKNMKDLGWVLQAGLLVFAYFVPIIVWMYCAVNGLHVALVQLANSLFVLTYALFVKIFFWGDGWRSVPNF